MSDYFDIPEVAYCRINRAAQLINCEVEDIYHWMETETISGYINIPYETDSFASFNIPGKKENVDGFLRELDWSGGYFPFTAYSIGTVLLAKAEEDDYPTEYNDWLEVCSFNGLICGVWKIDSGLQYLFDDESDIEIRRLVPYGFYSSDHPSISANVKMKIDKKNIWLVKDDIEKLSGKKFRSIDGGLGDISKKIATDVYTKKNSPKTLNLQAQFIKSLLHIHYGDDVAQSPRRFLEKKESEISMDFYKLGITHPSGKAVQSWIEMVDIPFDEDK
ncbi:hypothetical protein [Citrobacter amalonaticus]|uniref:hypothetical protein n=1 Tax=Citrobacter amalonaticus TaxID=35703 RepID=UPI0028BFB0F5|nr:hypothetical protein [Citrobacter amalonaticus]